MEVAARAATPAAGDDNAVPQWHQPPNRGVNRHNEPDREREKEAFPSLDALGPLKVRSTHPLLLASSMEAGRWQRRIESRTVPYPQLSTVGVTFPMP